MPLGHHSNECVEPIDGPVDRFEPRRDGVWLSDVGSTNGTFVNGARLERPRRLAPGDVIRIGATDLRFDA